jgi:hypothetical protein
MPPNGPHAHDPRPDFMITLGLAPPYAKEDVKQAYLTKAKQVHPDHGGTAAAFQEVHAAFEAAQAYLEFRSDRRAWISAKMNRYIALESAAVRIRALGAEVVSAAPKWLEQSFGDFAQLAEVAVRIRAIDAPNGDEIIAAMVDDYSSLRELEVVELTGCRVSDDAVLSLAIFQQLMRLNLSRTPITRRAVAVVDQLPALISLGLDGANVGWWTRRRVAGRLQRRMKS